MGSLTSRIADDLEFEARQKSRAEKSRIDSLLSEMSELKRELSEIKHKSDMRKPYVGMGQAELIAYAETQIAKEEYVSIDRTTFCVLYTRSGFQVDGCAHRLPDTPDDPEKGKAAARKRAFEKLLLCVTYEDRTKNPCSIPS